MRVTLVPLSKSCLAHLPLLLLLLLPSPLLSSWAVPCTREGMCDMSGDAFIMNIPMIQWSINASGEWSQDHEDLCQALCMGKVQEPLTPTTTPTPPDQYQNYSSDSKVLDVNMRGINNISRELLELNKKLELVVQDLARGKNKAADIKKLHGVQKRIRDIADTVQTQITEGGCKFYTYFGYDSPDNAHTCTLLSRCDTVKPCVGCHWGPRKCPKDLVPWDCEYMRSGAHPDNGRYECDPTSCSVWCYPGYVAHGSSTVTCSDGLANGTIGGTTSERKRLADEPKRLQCEPARLLVTGGKTVTSGNSVELYSPSQESCRMQLPNLPSFGPFYDHSLNYVNGFLLLCGGYHEGETCFQMTQKSNWMPHSPLTSRRYGHASGVVRDYLYLIGGETLSSERYETFSMYWEPWTELPEGSAPDGCAINDSPLTVVYTGGSGCPTCALRGSLWNGQWDDFPHLRDARRLHGCTNFMMGNEVALMVAGGWNQQYSNYVATTEIFNPQTREWNVVANLPARAYVRLATIEGGTIVAVGGVHDSTPLAQVEVFDLQTNSWQSAPNLTIPRVGHAITAVPSSSHICSTKGEFIKAANKTD